MRKKLLKWNCESFMHNFSQSIGAEYRWKVQWGKFDPAVSHTSSYEFNIIDFCITITIVHYACCCRTWNTKYTARAT